MEKRSMMGNKRALNMAMAVLFCVAYMLSGVAEVPAQKDFAAAEKIIADLLESELAAVKAGKKKPVEVADYAMSLVDESDTVAAKFLLARRACELYSQSGAYDSALKSIAAMRAAVPDMPDGQLLKAIQPVVKGATEKNAPAVVALVADLKARVRCREELPILKANLKRAKASERDGLNLRLAECYTVLGDWPTALTYFAKSGGKVATMSAAESDGSADLARLAGFWWDYSEDVGIKKPVASAVRKHAVEIYKKGLEDGTITGLNKTLAERRVGSGEAIAEVAPLVVPLAVEKEYVPKGLAHRWSFNGNVEDSVGNADGEIGGNGRFEDGQCVLNRGWIVLNQSAHSFNGDFTLEIWTTENERAYGSRVFQLASSESKYLFGWATGTGSEGYFHADGYSIQSRGTSCQGFALGIETYVAMTCKKVGGRYQISAYMFRKDKGRLNSISRIMDWPEPHDVKGLGLGNRVINRNHIDAISSFNECRVWTRCLSRGEIERSVKAGPDKLPKF